MPVHDWTRVDAGILHDFHVSWIPEIKTILNTGLLPEGYYALAEQHAGAALPDMPLFLRPDRYVNVPLEQTYQSAYRGVPAFWRALLEARET